MESDDRGPPRPALLPLAAVLAALATGCPGSGTAPATACDGLEERRLDITPEEYRPCAGEIIATLDSLQRHLERLIVDGDSRARSEAERAHAHLRLLLDKVGLRAETFRELRGEGRTVERWPDATLRRFNEAISDAASKYTSTLRHPNRGNLEEGTRSHERARREFTRFP